MAENTTAEDEARAIFDANARSANPLGTQTMEFWAKLYAAGLDAGRADGGGMLEHRVSQLLNERDALRGALSDLCEVMEAVGPWGEENEQTRVCDLCGGAGPDGQPDACVHFEQCEVGLARAVLSRCGSDPKLDTSVCDAPTMELEATRKRFDTLASAMDMSDRTTSQEAARMWRDTFGSGPNSTQGSTGK